MTIQKSKKFVSCPDVFFFFKSQLDFHGSNRELLFFLINSLNVSVFA